MAYVWCTIRLISIILYLSFPVRSAASIPPLQWINITGLLSGPSAPPLKGASLGYDDTSRSLLIFGGESAGGFVQSKTYLLRLDTLTWTTPFPPNGLGISPPARSNAISSEDMAASNRHAHIVIGGKGADGLGLSDVWEYDYINQFWASVNIVGSGPSPRWGAAGGSDPRIAFLPIGGVNNSFYLAGGGDGTTAYPLSDLWRLNTTGTLSSNLPNQVSGSWEQLSVNTLPSKVAPAGSVISQQVVAVGGCNTTSVAACAESDSYVISTTNNGSIAPNSCTVPRVEPVLALNLNTVSSSFASQVFLLLGTYNSSLWSDNNGLEKGEVAILDTNTGSWSRVIPAGDPDSTYPYPSPRSGAAAISFSQTLVGTPRSRGADTIVYGGQDANGTYLSEVWILRSYNGSVAQSGDQWAGYGNGVLTSGISADGSGVTLTFLPCAQLISQPSGSSTSSTSSTPKQTQTSSSSMRYTHYDTHFAHKFLATLSIAVLLPAILLYRMSSSLNPLERSGRKMGLVYSAALAAISAYGMGIGGLATSFTTISLNNGPITKRSSTSLYLKTTHGRAGIALFVAFYGLIPVLVLALIFIRMRGSQIGNRSVNAEEKETVARSSIESPFTAQSASMWNGFWNREAKKSSESIRGSQASSGPSRSFEVTNRPSRHRRSSGNALSTVVGSRGLDEMGWHKRRPSSNMVGDLDFALSQMNRGPGPATPEVLSTNALMDVSHAECYYPEFPTVLESSLHVLFHILLFGLCILTLVELWTHAPVATFAVFLVWMLLFYASVLILAWNGQPKISILAVVIYRLRTGPPQNAPDISSPPRPLSTVEPDSVTTPEARSPYIHHQPPFRATLSAGHEDDLIYNAVRHADTEDEDDDEDDESRQRRMEDEMNRRDVSIVTVPRRKLRITNPS